MFIDFLKSPSSYLFSTRPLSFAQLSCVTAGHILKNDLLVDVVDTLYSGKRRSCFILMSSLCKFWVMSQQQFFSFSTGFLTYWCLGRLNSFLDRLVSATVVIQKGTLWIFKREFSDKLCMETWKVFKRESSSVQTLLICTYWLSGSAGGENICLKVRSSWPEPNVFSSGPPTQSINILSYDYFCFSFVRSVNFLLGFLFVVNFNSHRFCVAVHVFPALSLRRVQPSYGTFFLLKVFWGNSAQNRTGQMIIRCHTVIL